MRRVRRTAIPVVAALAVAAAASAAGAAAGVAEADREAKEREHHQRPKVVVLGSGWGAVCFLKGLSEAEAEMYDITVISMRNHFLYTPLLPSCTMGSIEERSIMTPIRQILAGKADFLEAKVEHIDTLGQALRCKRVRRSLRRKTKEERVEGEGETTEDASATFYVNYDILIYAVGAESTDFNCPGVKDYAFFFKEIGDARSVRERISDLFEEASMPLLTEEEMKALLSFVIVGGGPTGVEVVADLADFVAEDCAVLYPKLVEHVRIRLINTGEQLLSMYDAEVSKASLEVFEKKGVEVLSGCKVIEVTQESVKIKMATGEITAIPQGCVVWCAGTKENDLTTQVKASLVEKHSCSQAAYQAPVDGECEVDMTVDELQRLSKGLVTDEWLHVRGSAGTIFALGDASNVQNDRASLHAMELFKKADVDGSGQVDLAELRALLRSSSEEFPQFEAYAQYLEDPKGSDDSDEHFSLAEEISRVLGLARAREERAFQKALEIVRQPVGARTVMKKKQDIAEDLGSADADGNMQLNLEEFTHLLGMMDKNLRTFPQTAQVAAQQGKYLAKLFADGLVAGDDSSLLEAKKARGAFTYFHKGSLAYLGGGSAAFDLPIIGPVTGRLAGLAWKAYETSAQLSWKNRALVGLDWLRNSVFGRDTSRT